MYVLVSSNGGLFGPPGLTKSIFPSPQSIWYPLKGSKGPSYMAVTFKGALPEVGVTVKLILSRHCAYGGVVGI